MTNKTLVVVAAIVITIATIVLLNQPKSLFSSDDNGQNGTKQSHVVSNQHYTYTDILNNHEFKLGMQEAVENNDIELAKSLQEKALEIAFAANLADSEIKLISGENGLKYMQFLASRQIFVEKFQQRYIAFKDIEQLKLDYPEAQDLFERSDKLIELRDNQLQQIAKQLAGETGDVDLYFQLAKEQWKARQQEHLSEQ